MKNFFKNITAAAALILAGAGVMAADAPSFAYGADMSWATWQEKCGVKFYQADEKTQTTVDELLPSFGFNAARLRVWVNPENYANDAKEPTAGQCTIPDVVEKAKRMAAAGQSIMIAFHFSDTWCDPGKQRIPAAWEPFAADIDKLTELAVAHVEEVLHAVTDAGVDVTWVQLGNEDGQGFMYHKADGSGELPGALTWSSQKGYIQVFNACAAKARELCPCVKVVHHLANAQNYTGLASNLNKVYPRGTTLESGKRIDADYLGLSLYPQLGGDDTSAWQEAAESCIENIKKIHKTYGLRSLIVETGMNADWTSAPTQGSSQKAHTTRCNADVKAFAEYFLPAAKESGVCDGVFYWEPQSLKTSYGSSTSVDGNSGYSMGAMMDIERNTKTWGERMNLAPNAYWHVVKAQSTAGIDDILAGDNVAANGPVRWFTLQGVPVAQPSAGAVYIRVQGNQASKVAL